MPPPYLQLVTLVAKGFLDVLELLPQAESPNTRWWHFDSPQTQSTNPVIDPRLMSRNGLLGSQRPRGSERFVGQPEVIGTAIR
jgi:hypothetical protein